MASDPGTLDGPGIWLLRHKQHTGVASMPYDDRIAVSIQLLSSHNKLGLE